MKKTLLKILPLVFIIILSMTGLVTVHAKVQNAETVTEATDVHYSAKYCLECHKKTPVKGGNILLKFEGDFTQLCRCHGYTPGTYIHPVDITPSKEKKEMIPIDFPLQDGKLTCITCHDMYKQCQPEEKNKLNKKFLRGYPFLHRTDLCFRCHDEKKYKRLDPHKQIDAEGNIIKEKCLYCHVEKPDEKTATFKDIKVIGNLEVLCFRCHFEKGKFHPINATHLRKPSNKTVKSMKAAERKYGIILPLNYKGRITCATCHNPHEKGVIPAEKPGAKGASVKYRFRFPLEIGQICVACHKDKMQ